MQFFKFGREKREMERSVAPVASIGPAAKTTSSGIAFEHANISIERRFVQDGFVVIQNVFEREEIKEFRELAIKYLPQQSVPYKPQFSNGALFEKQFWSIFENEKFVGALRSLLGDDFVFINELALHDSFFSGWHTDTTSPEGKGGHDFHWKPSFCVVNAGIYLQDNGPIGGGLDVIPRSHLRDDPLSIPLRMQNSFPPDYRADYTGTDPYTDVYSIPAKAGDLVIFNLRISHRSSLATREATNDDDRKLAFFLLAGVNNSVTRRYREWKSQYDTMNNATAQTIPQEFRDFLALKGMSII